MQSMMWQMLYRAALVVIILSATIGSFAQRSGRAIEAADDNFESPTPILLTEKDSTRALATPADGRYSIGRPVRGPGGGFKPGSKVFLYVSDLALLSNEGANAFRIYADDGRGHLYRFPVLAIEKADKNVWAITVLLRDEIGYYQPLAANGDVLIYLTWRGLKSNTCRLGIGRTGGDLKGDTGKPTPIGTTARMKTSAAEALTGRQADRMRFQEQAAFGPTAVLSAQLDRTKLSNWIESQFLLPYPDASYPYPNQPLMPNVAIPTNCDGQGTDDIPGCFRDTYTMYPIQTWNSQMMLYGNAQLRHKIAWALSQIWVTSGVDIQQSRWMVEYHKVLSRNAFGNYRTLMREMTVNPTMGEYLSMNLSTRVNPNENYAREIMQLFTIGLFMLNQDGTLQRDGNGDPIPTYQQTQVNELTRVFTGWTLCNTGCANSASGIPNYIDPMLVVVRTNHDTGTKTLLNYPGAVGMNIAQCSNCTTLAATQAYASSTMDQALDNIFYHPNVGPFVSKNLIQQLVTSDPTPAYVGRVAAVFNDNGAGVRGDMKSVISAILLDPEARGNTKTDPNYGKLREPVSYAANLLRAFDVRDAAGTGLSDGVLTISSQYIGMGQTPFRSPTVFNYYPPDFIIPGTSLLGPEFALMTTGTTVQRANFANLMVYNNIPITPTSNTGGSPSGTSLYFADLQAISAGDPTGNALVDELNRRMMHGTMSAEMKNTILTALAPTSAGDLGRVRQAVYLVATSSQYQVQR